MRRDLKLYLWDMIAADEDIEQFLLGMSFTDYENNRMVRLAVERCFEIVGEALWQACGYYAELKDKIGEHREIVNFRHRIIHGYFALDDAIVYSVAQTHLPRLLAQLRSLAESLPS